MKRKLMLFMSLLLISIGMATAQTQVGGVVVDETGEPVIGATILTRIIHGKAMNNGCKVLSLK